MKAKARDVVREMKEELRVAGFPSFTVFGVPGKERERRAFFSCVGWLVFYQILDV